MYNIDAHCLRAKYRNCPSPYLCIASFAPPSMCVHDASPPCPSCMSCLLHICPAGGQGLDVAGMKQQLAQAAATAGEVTRQRNSGGRVGGPFDEQKARRAFESPALLALSLHYFGVLEERLNQGRLCP
eukprot:1160006-Pelagomonas_calceolata.AAC.14